MKFKECLSETSWECRCWLCNSTLCTCKLSCKSWEEVILCLLRWKNRYRWENSKCICWKEDNILCCWCRRDRTNNVLDMIDRIRNTSVLCYALIIEINLTIFVKCNILKKSISLDSIVDVRLWLFVKVDNLSVTSTFKVEYTLVIPAVLIITDKKSLRVCRKCCLTCSWKTEEDCCILTV